MAMLGSIGVTVIEVSTADVTFTCEVPVTPSRAALMVALPAECPVICPRWLGALLTVTDAGLLLDHVAELVRSSVLPSEKVPMALNCDFSPLAMINDEGRICNDVSVAVVTVTGVDPEMPLKVALIVAVPGAIAVTSPCDPLVLLTVAIDVALDAHVAVVVRSSVDPSENWPVAVS